ncbi:MAG: hypothetical protein ABIH10_01295 [Spirochaetota bacterium]
MFQAFALKTNFISLGERDFPTNFVPKINIELSKEIDSSIKVFVSAFVSNSVGLPSFEWAGAEENTFDIKYKNPEIIMEFQAQFPEVKNYISQAQKVIKEYFPMSELELEIFTDHDSDTEFKEMFLHIKTNTPIKEALKLLENINKRVFIAPDKKDQLLFNIDIESD